MKKILLTTLLSKTPLLKDLIPVFKEKFVPFCSHSDLFILAFCTKRIGLLLQSLDLWNYYCSNQLISKFTTEYRSSDLIANVQFPNSFGSRPMRSWPNYDITCIFDIIYVASHWTCSYNLYVIAQMSTVKTILFLTACYNTMTAF